MGAASLMGLGNGNSGGGMNAISEADQAIRDLDTVIARINSQAQAILEVSTNLLREPPNVIDRQDLRLMLVDIADERDQAVRKRFDLTEARRGVAESEATGTGDSGLMFGLGTLGIVSALVAGLVALVAATVAWIGYVINNIGARDERIAQITVAENSRRADMGLPPLPATRAGGTLATITASITTIGLIIALVILGPPLVQAIFGGRKRRASG